MVTRNRVKWTMLWTYLINFVLVLVLASNASAADYTWDDGANPNELWTAANNWSSNIVPTSADTAEINIPDVNCLINSTVTAECTTLTVGRNKGPCYLTMTGGSLASTGNLVVGNTTDSNGVFKMSGGTARTIGADARLQIGMGVDTTPANNAFGTFIMTGGVVDVNGTKIEVGKNLTGKGRMYISGGTLNIIRPGSSGDFEIGKRGNAAIVMTGGDVNVLDAIKLSESGGTSTIDMDGGRIYCGNLRLISGTPTIYLDGGDVNCSDVNMATADNGLIDITEGELIVRTDAALSYIQRDYINHGKIIGYHGDGYAIAELYGGNIHITARLSDPNLAWKPSPGNYATVEWTPAGPTLSWKPGRYENKHDVYFGTDEDDVNDATDPNTLPGRGRQDPCTFAFPAPPPELGQTYYWRIDEVNDACAPNIWKGLVWQFTMADYEEVEDFNSYADDAALQAVWTLTGSEIHRETTIRRSGNSMKYVYTSGSATEAYANTTGAYKLPVDITDWTTVDIKALTLYFYGDWYNSAEKMYVALKDTGNHLKVVYYDDPNDINEPEWHEWNIKLSDFTDVNLRSIAKVYIGFDTPTSGGTVYFDDIRLYSAKCVASFAPEGDVDGDCDVDFDDVSIMAGDWLETDYNGVGRDGVLKGGASWVADGTRGRCIQLDGTNGWVDLNDSDFSNFRNKTIAFWVKIGAFPSSYPYMFYFSNGEAVNPYRIYFQTYTPASYYVRVRFVEGYSGNFTAGIDTWRHVAFVLEDTDDGKCKGTFYGDGSVIYPEMTGRSRHSGGAIGVNLGSANNGSSGFVNAVFDDFRVYDKVLTSTEVEDLYYGGGPTDKMLLRYTFDETSGLTAHNSSTFKFYHPLLSDAELYEGEAKGSRVVNLKDFAILADSWLEEQLWP